MDAPRPLIAEVNRRRSAIACHRRSDAVVVDAVSHDYPHGIVMVDDPETGRPNSA